MSRGLFARLFDLTVGGVLFTASSGLMLHGGPPWLAVPAAMVGAVFVVLAVE